MNNWEAFAVRQIQKGEDPILEKYVIAGMWSDEFRETIVKVGDGVHFWSELPRLWLGGGGPLVPFEPPKPVLTPEEREAVERAASTAQEAVDKKLMGWETDAATPATLRGLLERLGCER